MPGLPAYVPPVLGCALLIAGLWLAANAEKLFGDWRTTDNFGRVLRRLIPGPVFVRVLGVAWILAGLAILAQLLRHLTFP